jgi:hypothetical protein
LVSGKKTLEEGRGRKDKPQTLVKLDLLTSDSFLDRQTESQTDTQTDTQTHRHTDRRIDRWTERQRDG